MGNKWERRKIRRAIKYHDSVRRFIASGGKRCCASCRLGWRCPTDREDVCAMWELEVKG